MPKTPLLQAMQERVLVADGAMGTMLQAADLTLADFEDYDGCNEILNVTRPDVVAGVHRAYFDVGVDCVETNTFGANWANLAEYDIVERIYELAEAGARIAREVADSYSDGKDRYVLGSVGPGTKLPSLGHTDFRTLRDAYFEEVRGLIDGGADAVLIETAQDLLQAKAAIIGARRAILAAGADIPIFAQVTVETTGTMLLGSEIGAALTALRTLGIDAIGLNCATGPAEMSEHLRYLAQNADLALTCMPNAGLPQLTSDGAFYPLTPSELADAHDRFTHDYGLNLVGGSWSGSVGVRSLPATSESSPPSPRSTNQFPSTRTPLTSRSANARTPTVPRRFVRRCSRPAGRTVSRSRGPRSPTARICSTCVSTTSAETEPRT